MTTMKPCPKCHSTEHLRIEIVDDYLTDTLSAKVACTQCNVFSQRHYVFNGTTDDERPNDVQLTREVIEQWNETCDDWEGVSTMNELELLNELKPCPFCGEAPTIRNGKWGNNELVIICCESPQCFVMPATSILMGYSMEETAYAWNSRSGDGA